MRGGGARSRAGPAVLAEGRDEGARGQAAALGVLRPLGPLLPQADPREGLR